MYLFLLFILRFTGRAHATDIQNTCSAKSGIWSNTTNSCFKHYDRGSRGKTWSDSYAKCVSAAPAEWKGRLALIPNEDVLEAIRPTFSHQFLYWIGLKARNQSKISRYEGNGTSFPYKHEWAFFEGDKVVAPLTWLPKTDFRSYGTEHGCMRLNYYLKFGNRRCGDKMYQICEFLPPDCEVKKYCSSTNGTWSPTTSSCFKQIEKNGTQSESYQNCISEAPKGIKGRLAVISSETVSNLIRSLVLNKRHGWSGWFGLKARNKSAEPSQNTSGTNLRTDQWAFFEGNVMVASFLWGPRHVYFDNNETYCMYLHYEKNESNTNHSYEYYSDRSCNDVFPAVCEFQQVSDEVVVTSPSTAAALPTTTPATTTTTTATATTTTATTPAVTSTTATRTTITATSTTTTAATTTETTKPTLASTSTTTATTTKTIIAATTPTTTFTTKFTKTIVTTTTPTSTSTETTKPTVISTSTAAATTTETTTPSTTPKTTFTKKLTTTIATATTPTDCWDHWLHWSNCTRACGGGEKRRIRTKHAGLSCYGDDFEKKSCNNKPCQVCQWNEWSRWGLCSVTCGNGTRVRFMTKWNEGVNNTGADCKGPRRDVGDCNGTCIEAFLEPETQVLLTKSGILSDVENDPSSLSASVVDSSAYVTAELSEAEKLEIGHELEQTVPLCFFDGKACLRSDWKIFYDGTFGSCFTFNFMNPPNYHSYKAGAQQGLVLLVQGSQNDYMCSSQSAGFKLQIHNHTEYPFPDSSGTTIGRLPFPYGNCVKENDKDSFYYDGAYTVEGCLRSCFQQNTIKECGCGDPRIPLPAKNSKYCNIEQKGCLDYNRECEQHDVENLCKHCNQPCSETVFSHVVSTSQMERNDLLRHACRLQNSGNETVYSHCIQTYKKNFAIVRIYYESMTSVVYVESPGYTLADLCSEFGGVIGIVLGTSAITFVEFIFAVVDLVMFISTSGQKSIVPNS